MSLTEHEIEAFDGLMLGDGGCYLCSKRNQGAGYVILGSSQREWAEYGMSFLSRYIVSTPAPRLRQPRKLGGKSSVDWVSRTHSWCEFAEQRKRWYPDGKKVVPGDVRLTSTSILLWFLGDGTRSPNGAYITFATCDFTEEEHDSILIPGLASIGISSRRIWCGKNILAVPSIGVRDLFRVLGDRSPIHCYEHKFRVAPETKKTRTAHLAADLGVSVAWLNNLLNDKGINAPVEGRYRVFDQNLQEQVIEAARARLECRELPRRDQMRFYGKVLGPKNSRILLTKTRNGI
jgi:hypothetical protein